MSYVMEIAVGKELYTKGMWGQNMEKEWEEQEQRLPWMFGDQLQKNRSSAYFSWPVPNWSFPLKVSWAQNIRRTL